MILSSKHGGSLSEVQNPDGTVRPLKTYCKYFVSKPTNPKTMLCSGGGLWECCPDYHHCSKRLGVAPKIESFCLSF
jgi:hypothetical protein